MNVGDLVRYAEPDPDCVEVGVVTSRHEGWLFITWWADGNINNEGWPENDHGLEVEDHPDPTAVAELKDLMRSYRELYVNPAEDAENLPPEWADA